MSGAPDPTGQHTQIDDPDQLSQTQRITELLERRRSVIDARDEAFDAQLLGQAAEREALAYYRSRIESLILDLWTKFSAEEMDGEEYLDSEVIDEVEVPPPEEMRPGSGDLGPGASAPEPKTRTIEGLKWFIENDGPIEVPFTARLSDPPGQQTAVQQVPIPRKTLDKALIKCIEFLDEAGIDADIVTDDGDAAFDYSDILENGPPEENGGAGQSEVSAE